MAMRPSFPIMAAVKLGITTKFTIIQSLNYRYVEHASCKSSFVLDKSSRTNCLELNQQNRTEEYNQQNNTLHSTMYKESRTAGRKDRIDNRRRRGPLSF